MSDMSDETFWPCSYCKERQQDVNSAVNPLITEIMYRLQLTHSQNCDDWQLRNQSKCFALILTLILTTQTLIMVVAGLPGLYNKTHPIVLI